MRAKEYLSQLSNTRKGIERRQEQLEELRGIATGARAIRYDKETPGAPATYNRTEDLIIECVELEMSISGSLAYYVQLKDRILEQIEDLSWDGERGKKYADLLYKRYVEDKELIIIAKEMTYTEGYTRHLHGEALRAFWRKYLSGSQDNTFT